MAPITNEAPRTAEQKEKAAAVALEQIEKTHGKGAIFSLSSKVGIEWPHIPTGILSLDYEVLGIGGIPRGRITEMFGPEAGGKTTLTLQVIAEAQRLGDLCAYIDAEHALDPNWAKKLGVNVGALRVSQPDNGEQALQIAETLIESQAFGLVVVDSVAALVPRAELEGEIGDANVGLQARMMSQALRILSGKVSKSNTALVFINQIREKIGVMFGSPETTAGGRALKFYASVRLDIRRIQGIKQGDQVNGNVVRIRAAKNRLSAPFRETEAELLFDRGFDSPGNVLKTAIAVNLIEKKGAWLVVNGEQFQGFDNARNALALDSKVLGDLRSKVIAKIQDKENTHVKS